MALRLKIGIDTIYMKSPADDDACEDHLCGDDVCEAAEDSTEPSALHHTYVSFYKALHPRIKHSYTILSLLSRPLFV
jgi:hypothetical protein